MTTEIIEIVENIETPTIFDLWEKKRSWVESTDFHLSFSKLKKFRQSPLNFVQYIVGQDQTSDAMKFGQIDHVLILEGQNVFDRQYLALDRPTNLAANASKDGKIGKIEYAEILETATAEGKTVVKKQDVDKSIHIREMLMGDEICRELILGCTPEQSIDFNLIHDDTPFRFKGRIDGVGQGYKFDLKNMQNFTAKNIRQHILNELIHVQAAIYQLSEIGNFNDDYYIIACDGNNVLPILLKPSLIERGVKDLKKILDKFELCKLEYSWFQSVGFWHRNGVLEIE